MTDMSTSTDAALYRLLTWLSPGYPLGAFSYSHGLEQAVEDGLVRDATSLAAWVTTIIAADAGWSDAAIFAAAWRAAAAQDTLQLDEIAELASAWRATAETALESEAQGAAFLATTRAAWPHASLDALAARHRIIALPVAVAVAAAAHGIALAPALTAYLHGFAANLVSAGVRLIPLGQSDGQRVLALLEAPVAACCGAALATPLDDVGTASFRIERCSMRHETQYTRLFRS
jgi:urease accessory protein